MLISKVSSIFELWLLDLQQYPEFNRFNDQRVSLCNVYDDIPVAVHVIDGMFIIKLYCEAS